MQLFLLTIFGVCLITGCMGLGLMLGFFFGRVRLRRRCACAEARRVGQLIEQRKKATREARTYSPETVDPDRLPILDVETTAKR